MEKNNKQYCNISLLITGYSKTGKTTLLIKYTGETLGGFKGDMRNVSMECVTKVFPIQIKELSHLKINLLLI